MKHQVKRVLTFCVLAFLLIGILSIGAIGLAVNAASEPQYKVEIVSFVRGQVDPLRCSELLEARIYKSVDGGNTWTAVTDVEGTPVSELTYTWTNTSNTLMAVFRTHNMAVVDIYGEKTFKNDFYEGVGAQWAALKTPGYDGTTIGGMGGWPSWGGGSNRPSTGGSSSSVSFSGSVTVQVALPDGSVLSRTLEDFDDPSLKDDLDNLAIGIFKGDSETLKYLLGESALVHINCSYCTVSDVVIQDNNNEVTYSRNTLTGVNQGECTITMDVSKSGCTVHHGQEASVTTKVFVFSKPETSTTTTTLTLRADTVDTRCKFYINGVEGQTQANGDIVFTGLTPNTTYVVDVVASYSPAGNEDVVRYAYAYVSDTTKPVYTATVNTYLNDVAMDVDDIHGEEVLMYIKADGGDYIPLTHSGTGAYTANVESGVYYVYHLENSGYHPINDNPLIIANAPAKVAVNHYSVSYDTAGGEFKTGQNPGTVNYASGQKVVVTDNVPVKEGYVFAGWSYGGKTYKAGDTVTNGITSPVILLAQWERKVNVRVDITIDHTYTDASGVVHTDINSATKSDIDIALVARDNSSSPYLEVNGYVFTLTEESHSSHTLYADGNKVNSYAGLDGEAVTVTRYVDGDDAIFTDLSGEKEYFVTASKAGYDASISAEKEQNGDWTIHVSLKFDPQSQDLSFELNMDPSIPQALYPKAAIVKILYFNDETDTWELITQHSDSKPGVRVEIEGQTGNKGSYPVWVTESETGKAYGYRIMVSAFVYGDGTIVPTVESTPDEEYTDKNYTATVGNVTGGANYEGLLGAFFENNTQKGTLYADISVQTYDVTFHAMGGKINGNDTQIVADQYYIPDFDNYTPVMNGHNFLGWWYQDADGNYVRLAEDGVLLTEHITVYALWDQHLSGSLTVAGTYMLNNQEVSIWTSDRANEAIVVLQEIVKDGLKNIGYKIVTIDWTRDPDTGFSDEYVFTDLDPMREYRINVLLVNYKTQYQNATTAGDSYNDNDYQAVFVETDKWNTDEWNTKVNGNLTFEPESYQQPIEVDGSLIGPGDDFRPETVLVQIYYKDRNTSNDYKLISQHVSSGGINVALDENNGTIGTALESIWKTNFNGNLYDYKLVVHSGDAVLQMPITLSYGPIASVDTVTGLASNTLKVTLIPNKYDVIFNLNTGATDGSDILTDYEAHIWSYETKVDYTPVREGYIFKGWVAQGDVYDSANKTIKASVSEDVTLVAQWEKVSCDYTIEYYYDDVLKATETKTGKYLDVITENFDEKKSYNGETYALDVVTGQPLTLKVDAASNVIRVYYATDRLSNTDSPDGIPDKYQALVKFNVVNGTWKDPDKAKDRVYDLYTKNSDGVWTKLDSVPFGAAPEANPNAEYEAEGQWSPDIPSIVEHSATYTYSFHKYREYTVTVVVENGTAKLSGQNEAFATKEITVEHGDSITLEFAAKPGFALDTVTVDQTYTRANGIDLVGWDEQEFTNITGNHVIHVVYATDVVGNTADPNASDNIPDKYQKKVVFQVVNGTWDGADAADIVQYVTLKDDANGWAENGAAAMPALPEGMVADAGYRKGLWNVAENALPTKLTGTDPVTYIHTFKPIVKIDYIYYTEHYVQLPSGLYALAQRVQGEIEDIELNGDEDGFYEVPSAVTAQALNFGAHYRENTAHADRVASGVPVFGQSITLKLFYALDSHTVKYDLNNGTPISGVVYNDATVLCGSTVNAQVAPHRTGYTFEGWLANNGEVYAVNDVITVDADITLTAQWKKLTGLSYIVHYLDEETGREIHTEKLEGNKTFEDVVNSSDEVITIDGYLFSYADPASITIGVDVNGNVINLYYTRDMVGGGPDGDSSDNIPDKYQKKLTFKVVNGTWDGTNAADIIKYVTLKTNGEWDENGTAVMDATILPVGMVANQGFKLGKWDVEIPVTITATSNTTYTHTFQRSTTPVVPGNTVRYVLEHYKVNADGTYPTTATDTDILSGEIGATVNATARQYDGYCVNLLAEGTVASGKLVAITKADDIVTLKLYYDTDVVGGGTDGDSSDNIPDKYQKKLTFKVVNGTWDGTNAADIIKYVTLKTNGEWDVNGSAVVDETIVPAGMVANLGYQDGIWNTTFPVTVTGTDDVTYIHIFARSTTPVVPGNTVRYVLEHYKANADGTYPETATNTDILVGEIGATVTATAREYEGYCVNLLAEGTVASGKLVAIESADDIVTLKLYYDTDVVGGKEEDTSEDTSDEIPDQYQTKVIFKVVNGTWDGVSAEDIIVYVTLKTEGEWDVTGSAVVDATIVPTGMTANEGFEGGAWDATFSTTVKGTGDVVYTFTFVEKEDVIPPTGDSTQLGLWLALMVVSAAGICSVVLQDRKRAAAR